MKVEAVQDPARATEMPLDAVEYLDEIPDDQSTAEAVEANYSDSAELKLLRYIAYGVTHNWHDAEDGVQNAYMNVLSSSYKPRNVRKMMFRSVINACIDITRKRARTPWIGGDALEEEAYWQNPQLIQDDRTDRLEEREYLSTLGQYLDPIFLALATATAEGYTSQEMALMFNINENTVKSKLHRGRNRVRELCKEGKIEVPSFLTLESVA